MESVSPLLAFDLATGLGLAIGKQVDVAIMPVPDLSLERPVCSACSFTLALPGAERAQTSNGPQEEGEGHESHSTNPQTHEYEKNAYCAF